jgi:hypothetical protein
VWEAWSAIRHSLHDLTRWRAAATTDSAGNGCNPQHENVCFLSDWLSDVLRSVRNPCAIVNKCVKVYALLRNLWANCTKIVKKFPATGKNRI